MSYLAYNILTNENVVWMPRERKDGRANRFLDVLCDPPIVVGVKVTDGDEARCRADGEFVLLWTPLDGDGPTIDANEHQYRFPYSALVLSPHVDVSVGAARDDLVRSRSPVDSGYLSGVFTKFRCFSPLTAAL